jgi:SAM-dependent methyltransferase
MINQGHRRLKPKIWDSSYLHLRALAANIKEIVNEVDGENLVCLDAGCGHKPYYPLFANKAGYYVGLDTKFDSQADVIGTITDMPFLTESFDLVLCSQVLEYVETPTKALDEIYRVLKKGGKAIISVPGIWEDGGYYKWTIEGVRKLFQNFREVRIIENGGLAQYFFLMINDFVGRAIKFQALKPLKGIIYIVNNVLGLIFDRKMPRERLIENFVIVAEK